MLSLRLDKKAKYLIYAGVLMAMMYFFASVKSSDRILVAATIIVTVFIGNMLAQYPFIRWVNYAINLIPPMFLVLATMLALVYFPNLSATFKTLGVFLFGSILYVYLLVNNIFLVVLEKREMIPLYRVAITWSEIILTVMAIPLFTGIFKLDVGAEINFVVQSLLAGFVTVLFLIYVLWTVLLDTDAKRMDLKEGSALCLTGFFIVAGAKMAISFFQTESFLVAILISALLMFCLSMIQGHLKNTISRNLVIQFFTIILLFFVILLIYIP